jgi:hypothetical protein
MLLGVWGVGGQAPVSKRGPAGWARAVNAEASVRRSGCAAAARSSISASFSRCSPPQPRSRARPCSSQALACRAPGRGPRWKHARQPDHRPRQAGESDGRPPDREARPRPDPQAARRGTVREDTCACGASQRVRGPLRAILASELMGFGAVLEQGGRGGLIALRRAVREPTLVWPMLWEIASCA